MLHQMAIYEMNRPNGNFKKATEYLARARSLAPHDVTLTHSLAELQLRKAETAKSSLEHQTYLEEAQDLARTLTAASTDGSYGFHTLAKVQLTKLRRLMEREKEAWSDLEFSDAVKAAEEVIQQGLQKYPDDPYLLVAESELGDLLADDNRAETALQAAFSRNTSNPFIVGRLAKLLVKKGLVDDAVKVYKSSIDSGINDKQVHFGYAKLLIDENYLDGNEVEYHLRRAFTEGDVNVEAQFWYARQLYVNGKIDDAQERFRSLRDVPIDPMIKRIIRRPLPDPEDQQRFTGRVDKLEYDYAFIIRDGAADRVFLHVTNTETTLWEHLRVNIRLSFSIGFNFWGATAINVALEQILVSP